MKNSPTEQNSHSMLSFKIGFVLRWKTLHDVFIQLNNGSGIFICFHHIRYIKNVLSMIDCSENARARERAKEREGEGAR